MPERVLPGTADFNTVSAAGLKPPPVAAAPAGPAGEPGPPLQQQDGHVFTVEPASNANTTIDGVHRILNEERDIVISSRPLEATAFQIERIPMAYAFYQSGLSINLVAGVILTGLVAVPLGLALGALLPRELEAVLILIGIVGIQITASPDTTIASLLPFHAARQLLDAAVATPTPFWPQLAVTAIYSTALLGNAWAAWRRRAAARRPPAPAATARTDDPAPARD